jgi:ketosteroid isomerase-like protein
MSRDSAEVVSDAFRALNARDVEALVQLVDDDCEWRPALTAGGHLEGAVYRGSDGIARYVEDLDAEFVNTELRTESLRQIGDSGVLYQGRVIAEGRTSGIKLDVRLWSVWEVRAGKLRRGTAFLEENDALEAARVLE